VRVETVELRDFRSYTHARARLGPAITVLWGPNGAGKTNLLEGIYCACLGRGLRTVKERELVRFGAVAARAGASVRLGQVKHVLSTAIEPGREKRLLVDGQPQQPLAAPARPLVAVFLADRLALVKGPPRLRRAHLDALVAALLPAHRLDRSRYQQALRQRNALLAAIRAGRAVETQLAAWDRELSASALPLQRSRRAAAAAVAERLPARARELGLQGTLEAAYCPRSKAADEQAFLSELGARRDTDLRAGFCTHGPHRDELLLRYDGRELRLFGSQGEQRLALLALLLAEREALAHAGGSMPLMLLDDVMSELDPQRRELLVNELMPAGQCVITASDPAHVPEPAGAAIEWIEVPDGVSIEPRSRSRAA
jgi:DNA replication and repair protein RecF